MNVQAWGKLYAIIQFNDVVEADFAGLPVEVLSLDFWVPGTTSRQENPKYRGKAIFTEILQATPETALLWATRATKDSL